MVWIIGINPVILCLKCLAQSVTINLALHLLKLISAPRYGCGRQCMSFGNVDEFQSLIGFIRRFLDLLIHASYGSRIKNNGIILR